MYSDQSMSLPGPVPRDLVLSFLQKRTRTLFRIDFLTFGIQQKGNSYYLTDRHAQAEVSSALLVQGMIGQSLWTVTSSEAHVI